MWFLFFTLMDHLETPLPADTQQPEPPELFRQFTEIFCRGLHSRSFATDTPVFSKTGLSVTITVIATTGHELKTTVYYKPSAKSFTFSTRLPPEKTLRLEEQFFLTWAEFSNVLPSDTGVHIFTDGSYKDTLCSFAFIILKDGNLIARDSGLVPSEDTLGSFQIAGELQAVLRALAVCKQKGITSVTVHHDLKGVAEWATGTYKTKAVISQLYKERLKELGIFVRWQKEDAHTGMALNEYVDVLAKRAIAVELQKNPLPEIAADNPLSRKKSAFEPYCNEHGYSLHSAGYYAGNTNLKLKVVTSDTEYGYMNLYLKKGGEITAAFHELKSKSVRAALEKLWGEFISGRMHL